LDVYMGLLTKLPVGGTPESRHVIVDKVTYSIDWAVSDEDVTWGRAFRGRDDVICARVCLGDEKGKIIKITYNAEAVLKPGDFALFRDLYDKGSCLLGTPACAWFGIDPSNGREPYTASAVLAPSPSGFGTVKQYAVFSVKTLDEAEAAFAKLTIELLDQEVVKHLEEGALRAAAKAKAERILKEQIDRVRDVGGPIWAERALKLLKLMLHHDWYYDYSDDAVVYRRGKEEKEAIDQCLKALPRHIAITVWREAVGDKIPFPQYLTM
jgi:hypothetical protein